MQLQHELHHELLADVLELLFRSLLDGSSKRVCRAPANKHVALPICSDSCERLPPLQKLRILLHGGLVKSVHDQLSIRKNFEYRVTPLQIDCERWDQNPVNMWVSAK